jgi:hypothetical protein
VAILEWFWFIKHHIRDVPFTRKEYHAIRTKYENHRRVGTQDNTSFDQTYRFLFVSLYKLSLIAENY